MGRCDQWDDDSDNSVLIYILLFVAVVLGAAVLYIMFTNHALTSHSSQIKHIDNCYENGGAIFGPFTTSGGRMSEYCQGDDDRVYWRIFVCEEGEKLVITQFMQFANRVANYIFNHGMMPMDGDPGC